MEILHCIYRKCISVVVQRIWQHRPQQVPVQTGTLSHQPSTKSRYSPISGSEKSLMTSRPSCAFFKGVCLLWFVAPTTSCFACGYKNQQLTETRALREPLSGVSLSLQPFTWIVPGVLMGGEKRKAEKARCDHKAVWRCQMCESTADPGF